MKARIQKKQQEVVSLLSVIKDRLLVKKAKLIFKTGMILGRNINHDNIQITPYSCLEFEKENLSTKLVEGLFFIQMV